MWQYNYTYTDELYHYGIPGMRWGKRKNPEGYISVSQSSKKAKAAGRDAYRKSISDSKNSEGSNKLGSFRSANKQAKQAQKQARKQSISSDKAHNRALREKNKPVDSEDSRNAQTLKKKQLNELSNKELQDLNKRMELEQNYARLTNKKSKIKKVITGFIATAATATAVVSAAKKYNILGKEALDKIGNFVVKDLKFTNLVI